LKGSRGASRFAPELGIKRPRWQRGRGRQQRRQARGRSEHRRRRDGGARDDHAAKHFAEPPCWGQPRRASDGRRSQGRRLRGRPDAQQGAEARQHTSEGNRRRGHYHGHGEGRKLRERPRAQQTRPLHARRMAGKRTMRARRARRGRREREIRPAPPTELPSSPWFSC
jgi:hypothetical protein